ncbi:mucin-12-like [Ochotona princeps]|uniref:mucin-12-like n=1 Tax=Ochotona princeps TaxID=9978 RepID=UPI0027155101|nr:mucin-12-like [Ochotona princeps]
MWDGHECICAPGFFGEECQSFSYSFPLEIPDFLNATVTVVVKVTHRNFTADLKNTSSQAYQNFTKLFKEEMNKVYNFAGYEGVIIRSLTNGSIMVQNDVVLKIDYTPNYQQQFENLEKVVRDRIMNETSFNQNNDTICEGGVSCKAVLGTLPPHCPLPTPCPVAFFPSPGDPAHHPHPCHVPL